ncbi:hypothetical protein, partial [Moorena sp. SIO3A5]|uniref:hypothetical protein n=1 Tax=Moorena sp. SIO3A5 TaxID=2607822 RepID=UPI00338FC7F5
LPSTNPRKQTERSGYLGAGCGESRTPRFEGEVPWVIPGIDSNAMTKFRSLGAMQRCDPWRI